MNKNIFVSSVIFLIFVICLGIFLAYVFSGRLILPQAFSLGPFTVHYYGVIMALAVAGGFYLAIKRTTQYGLEAKQAEDVLFWLVIGGFVGARLYHVFSSIGYYSTHPIDILKVWNGGLSIYGAVIGGLITLLVLKRIFDFKFLILNLLDWLTPSLIVGQIIGRFGNLFNYEAFGYPTNLPWKMFVPQQFRPPQYVYSNFFHPFFLYELLGNAIILFLISYFERSRTRRLQSENQTLWLSVRDFAAQQKLSGRKILASGGSLFFLYLLLYNALRFGLEFLRIDSTFIGNFRLNAMASLLLCLIAGSALFYLSKQDAKTS